MDNQDRPTGPIRPEETQEVSPSRLFMKRIESGQNLFKEGDVDQRVFVLLDGRVEVLKGDEEHPAFIGEVSAFTRKPRWATARTLEASTFLVVEDVEEFFPGDATWGLRLARVLAGRLDRTNERLRRLQLLLQSARSGADENLVETIKTAVSDARRDA